MKKVKLIFAIFLAMLLMATPVLANVPTLTVDGVEFVQVRATAETLGWGIEWDGALQSVILTTPDGGNNYQIYVPDSGGFNDGGRVYISVVYLEFIKSIFEGVAAAYENANIHGMLTRVIYGENVAYIFGSMHASRPYWFPLHTMAEEAMARSDVFVFEVDMTELLNLSDEMAEEIEAIQMLPGGLTLEDILPEDVFENFITNLETYAALGLTYELVENVTPVALLIGLETVIYTLLGVDVEASVDAYIAEFAEANNKPVIGLNSILSEFDIVFNIPIEIQAYALVDFPDFATMLAAHDDLGLIELYATQNIDGIREMLMSIAAATEGNPYSDLLGYNLMYLRDNIFAEEIARLLQETEEPTTFFITMGIAHIIGGGYGIVFDLLEEMGFELTSLWNQ